MAQLLPGLFNGLIGGGPIAGDARSIDDGKAAREQRKAHVLLARDDVERGLRRDGEVYDAPAWAVRSAGHWRARNMGYESVRQPRYTRENRGA